MTKNPITITPAASISEALDLMLRNKVHRFPVLDKKGKLVGIVTHKDLLHASPSSVTSLSVWEMTYLLSQVTVKEAMTKEVITVCEDCPIEEAASLMADNNIGALPVMRDDRVVGIITESDLFKVFLELFGTREKGVRMTFLGPNVKGSLAEISGAVFKAGGFILALNIFLADDPATWGCHLKVKDVTENALVEAVKPHVVEIIDVREI
jgi:acetoin utilization protein AcuB